MLWNSAKSLRFHLISSNALVTTKRKSRFSRISIYYFIFLLFQSWNITSLQIYIIFHTFKTLHNLLKKKFFFPMMKTNLLSCLSFFSYWYGLYKLIIDELMFITPFILTSSVLGSYSGCIIGLPCLSLWSIYMCKMLLKNLGIITGKRMLLLWMSLCGKMLSNHSEIFHSSFLKPVFPFQDLISNSLYCLPYNSYEVSSENLVLDQLIIP